MKRSKKSIHRINIFPSLKNIRAYFSIFIAMVMIILLQATSNFAADSYGSTSRTPAGIYVMWIQKNGVDLFNKPWYVGQARRTGKTIDQMVQERVNEHLKESKFIQQLGAGENWVYDIVASSESNTTYDPNGWTSLETSLNEQASIVGYCEDQQLQATPTLLNSRNEVSQKDVTSYWNVSNSQLSNLLPSAKSGSTARAIPVPSGCLTK